MPLFFAPNYLGSFTYASLPAASGASGLEAFVSDWGANGTKVRSNGTRWLPIGGRTLLKHLGAAVSGITSAGQIALQYQVPAGIIQANDLIICDFTGITKSGATDSGSLNVYIGTAGTTSDANLTSSTNTILAAANRTADSLMNFKVVSSTSIQRVGVINGSGAYGGGGVASVAAPAATTVSDLSSSAVYISLQLASSGATDTIALQEAAIWHVAG